MVAVGLPAWVPSVEKLTVTVSPTLARVAVVLLEASVTAETTGAVLSKVTAAPLLRAVTGVMALPAASTALMAKATAPSVSPLCNW